MRILYLAHRIPYPPNKGDKLRSYRQLEWLAHRHEVWCACFIDDLGDELHVAPLQAMCTRFAGVRLGRSVALARGLAGLARGRSLTESFYDCPRMISLLEQWSRRARFDAVVAFSSAMAPHALRVASGRRILDLCDLDSAKWRSYAAGTSGPKSLLYLLEAARLGRREKAWISAFDRNLLITPAEVERLPEHLRSRVDVVANGVNLPVAENAAPSEGAEDSPSVGFVGVMDYRPNVDAVTWFVRHCWARIRQEVPGATFRIIGRAPTRSVRRLSRQPGVQVTGEVADAAAEVARLDVSVAPLRIAHGLQNKVLEAMAAARPVVLSSAAARGVDATPGVHVLIADDPDRVTQCVTGLLRDPDRRRAIGQAARRHVQARYRWDVELRQFEEAVTGRTPVAVPSAPRQPGVAPEPCTC